MTVRTILLWSLGVLFSSAAQPSFDELVAQIQTGNAYQRQRAVSVMVRTGDPRVVSTLVDLLKNADTVVRIGAAREMATLADPATADALAAALSDEDDRVRQHAAEGLLKIGSERHVPALVASVIKYLTGSPNPLNYQPDLDPALGAIGRLATAAPPEFVAMIDKISEEGSYEETYRWWFEAEIARCLGQIGDHQALDALRQARAILESGHQDYRTWYALCKAMASIDPNGSPFDRPAADILESIVWGKGGTYGEQPLGELGEEAIDDLEWVLQFDHQVDRDRVLTALKMLGNIGGPRVADILRHYVSARLTPPPRASSSEIGYRCVSALGALLRVVPTEITARKVFVLTHRLSSFEQESLVSTISSSSFNGVSNDVKQAFLEWTVFGSDQAGRLDRYARTTVIRGWAKTGGDHSGKLLSETLRAMARRVPWTSTDDRETIEITEAFRKIRDYDAVPTLIEAAQLPHVPKDAVAYALGDIGDARAVPALRELAGRNDLGDQDRLWAAAALVRLDIDYEENARVIRDALPNSLDQARWLHDRETVVAVAKLIALDMAPAQRYKRVSRFPTAYSRAPSLDEHAIAVLRSIGTDDVLEVLTGQIDIENITDLAQVRRLSSAAAQVAKRLDHKDQEYWADVTSLAGVVGGSAGYMTMRQSVPRPEDRDRIPASYRDILEKDPALARRMWIAEVNARLDGSTDWHGSNWIAGQAVRVAECIYAPELVPVLQRLVTECDSKWSMTGPYDSVSYYHVRSLAAELLTEKTGRSYTFVDVDGRVHPGGWDPSQEE